MSRSFRLAKPTGEKKKTVFLVPKRNGNTNVSLYSVFILCLGSSRTLLSFPNSGGGDGGGGGTLSW